MIDEKFARQRTYRNNINRYHRLLKPTFQSSSANSSRRIGQKVADDRETQARPKVVGLRLPPIYAGPTSSSGADRPYEGRRPTTMGILCGPAASIKESASTLLR
jgi:hypothetical protein